MKIIFEDHKNALLSRLFREAYEDTSNFIYADGLPNIVDVISGIKDHKEKLYVYMDTVPGNRDIRNEYRNLRKAALSRGNLMIFPIVCSEYYFLKAFGNRKDKDIGICINKGNYFASDSFRANPVLCRNFEKYCKYLIRHNVKDCMSHDSRSPLYEIFYRESCLCKNREHGCTPKSLVQKSIELLSQYDYVPAGYGESSEKEYADAELYNIHIKLVEEFNHFSDFLKKCDRRSNVNYYHIRPI